MMTELQRQLIELVRESGRAQVLIARDAGITEKHLSQMMTGKAEGSLATWQAVLDASVPNARLSQPPS